MSVAFAQQTELSRLSRGKENTTSLKQAHILCQQEEEHIGEVKSSQGQVSLQTFEEMEMKFKKEYKPLSKELEDGQEVVLSSNGDFDDVLELKDHGLTISEELFSNDESFIVKESVSKDLKRKGLGFIIIIWEGTGI